MLGELGGEKSLQLTYPFDASVRFLEFGCHFVEFASKAFQFISSPNVDTMI